jgi:hypothetical protein
MRAPWCPDTSELGCHLMLLLRKMAVECPVTCFGLRNQVMAGVFSLTYVGSLLEVFQVASRRYAMTQHWNPVKVTGQR